MRVFGPTNTGKSIDITLGTMGWYIYNYIRNLGLKMDSDFLNDLQIGSVVPSFFLSSEAAGESEAIFIKAGFWNIDPCVCYVLARLFITHFIIAVNSESAFSWYRTLRREGTKAGLYHAHFGLSSLAASEVQNHV